MNHSRVSPVHRAEALEYVAAVQAAEASLEGLRRDLRDDRISPDAHDRRFRRVNHDVQVGLKLAQVHAHLAVAEEVALLRAVIVDSGVAVVL